MLFYTLFNQIGYTTVYYPDCSVGFIQLADRQRLSTQQTGGPSGSFVPSFQLQQVLAQSATQSDSQSATQPTTQSETQSAQSFYDLGVEAQTAGQIQAAVQAYQQAIDLEPNFDAAYINLGLAFIQLAQFDKAWNTFQQVLTLPDRPERPASIHTLAHYNLAIILNRQGKLNEAMTEAQKALEITPDFEKAQQLLRQLQSSS